MTKPAFTPEAYHPPTLVHHLIDSLDRCRLALTSVCLGGAQGCMQLKQVYEGHAVGFTLKGGRLGTADERSSSIKVN